MSKRVYLSGPITGTNDYRERFAFSERKVRTELCYGNVEPETVNPVILGDLIPSANYNEIMRLCFDVLEMCDAIIMLPGWEKSKGCNQEYGFAKALGKEIYLWEELF